MPHLTIQERSPLGHLFPRPYEVPKHVTRTVRVCPERGAVLPQRFDPATGDATEEPRTLRMDAPETRSTVEVAS